MDKCKNCPLHKYNLENIECAAHSKPHPRYCKLSEKNTKYDDKIIEESIRIHNELVKEKGLSILNWNSVKTFANTMKDWVKKGFKKVPEHIYKERLNQCMNCENLVNGTNCSLCTCFVREKCAIPNSECPIKKWSSYSNNKGGCNCESK